MKSSLAISFLVFSPLCLKAHGLIVSATVSKQVVHIVVTYDDNTPARNAKVIIVNAAGETLSQGVTDDAGVVELQRPAELRGCKVKVDAGDGHARTVSLPNEGEAPAETKNRFLSTAVGLAAIAVIAFVLRLFWPKSHPKPA